MDDIQNQRAADTHIECPRCLSAGIVSASGYATRIICMPELDPPFRCLATHGGLSEQDLVAAGIDPRLLQRWLQIARDGVPQASLPTSAQIGAWPLLVAHGN